MNRAATDARIAQESGQPSPPAARQGALHGIKVLEISSMILGPLATQYLGDMGATVTKLEPPEGDLTRYIGPRRSPGMAAFFINSNRNKRSVVADIKRPEGRALLRRLIARSDVLLHSIRTPSAHKLGLAYDDLVKLNPKIILCHVKGFSDEGPYAGRAAYDDVAQALSGLASLQAVIGGEPRYIPSIVADKVSSLTAAFAMMTALVHRERTGRGQEVNVPMMETMVAFNAVEHLWGAAFVPPLSKMGYAPVSKADRRPFKTKDGYLCVLPYNDGHWKRFCEVVGDPALTNDPRFIDHAARQRDQPGFWAEVGRRVKERTSQEWIDALLAADVPFARVNSLDDLLDDPQLTQTGFWEARTHPTEGELLFPRSPMAFSDSPADVRTLAPGLGEHTQEVLRELGVADEEIERLHQLGVTRPAPKVPAAAGDAEKPE